MDSTNPTVLKTPWHFSPSLYQRLPNSPNAPYRLCEVTQQDPEGSFIHRHFQASKPTNYSIATVHCIHNSALINQFQSAIVTQEREAQNPTFAPKWSQENPLPLRQKIVQRWEKLTKPHTPFSIQWHNQRKDIYISTKVLPLWHGTKEHICQSICTTGFTTFGKHEIIHGTRTTQNTDIGFFGSGTYFTTSAKYAASTYSDGNLLLAWVSMREPYPVVADQLCSPPNKPSDMKKLAGLGAYQNYNAHYIPVVSVNPSDENCTIYYPSTANQEPAWDEIVVFQPSQALPLFWVKLQPDLLKSPSCPTVQHLLNQVLNLLEKTTIQQNHSLHQVLEQKTDVLIALHLGDPLTPQNQEFYNWSLNLLDETGRVRSYVQGKLQGMVNPPSIPPALEQKYQENKSYETSEGKPKNLAEVFKTDEELTQNATAQFNLGVRYANGRGVKKDEAKAVFWYQKAADQGNANAQCNLGFCYENGRGVERDMTLALFWYQKAADQGNAIAQFNLGFCYAHGRGVERDMTLAFLWYQKAAGQGYPAAQCNLGFCYENGRGVKRDMTLALFWYQKAADQGNANAQKRLEEIRG
jgi:hypothetical protein